MPDYRGMYKQLFAAQADAIAELIVLTEKMIKAQQEAEEKYISEQPKPIYLSPDKTPKIKPLDED